MEPAPRLMWATGEQILTDRVDLLVFQGEPINQLNEQVTRRGKQIETLRQQIEYLKQKYQAIRVSVVRPEDQETPPPHY